MDQQVIQAKSQEEKRSSSFLEIIDILLESFNISIKNGKILLSIIFFMSLCLLLLEQVFLILQPFLTNLVSEAVISNKGRKAYGTELGIDIQLFLLLEIVVFTLSSVILLFLSVAIVYSTYEAYTSKALSLEDALFAIKGRWRRPLITSCYMLLISVAYIFLFCNAIAGITGLLTATGLYYLIWHCSLVLFLPFYAYISAVWMLSLGVSVLEENRSGLTAIERANELIAGKRLQGCFLFMFLILLAGIIYWTCFLVAKPMDDKSWFWIASSVTKVWCILVVKLIGFVVYTIFYDHCKKCQMEKNVEKKPQINDLVPTIEV